MCINLRATSDSLSGPDCRHRMRLGLNIPKVYISLMDMKDLEHFLAVVKEGSILRAAEEQGIAQPALSRRMRALEQSLGVPLFNRTSAGVTLSEYGEVLEKHARTILRNRQYAIDELRSFGRNLVGQVNIGVTPALSGQLPTVIGKLIEQYPGLTFTVTEGTYASLISALRRGVIDGALTLLPAGTAPSGLRIEPLSQDRLRIFCSPRHALTQNKKLKFANLEDAAWALMSTGSWRTREFLSIAAEHGLKSPRIVVRTDSLDVLKSLVLNGPFLTVLPEGSVRAELGNKRVATLLPREKLPTVGSVFLCRDEVASPALKAFLTETKRSLVSV